MIQPMENAAKIFICNHPSQLFLFKNLSLIIKKYNPDIKVILLKVNHPYFSKFNFEPYKKYFDKIIEFKFIHYKKNFFLSYWEIFNFQKKLKKINNNLLLGFDKIDLFLSDSTWLPVNILLYNLSRQKNIKNITRFNEGQLESSQTKKDNIKALLCNLYTLPFKCYKVKVLTTLGGKFLNFIYVDQMPGIIVRIVNPNAQMLNNIDWEKENILPLTIVSKNSAISKRDMVIVFGDAGLLQDCSEYMPNEETYIKKLTNFFKSIEDKYSDSKLWYKPHPADGQKIMSGINASKYNLFDNSINAEVIFEKYHKRIKAVYTLSSTSVVMGSFFGIPSYTFYRYLCNRAGIDKFDNLFDQENIKSKFLFHISDSSEIGKIDKLKYTIKNIKNLDKVYRKVLNV